MELRLKRLDRTITPPATQKARGVWKLSKKSPFPSIYKPEEVFLGTYSTTGHDSTPHEALAIKGWPEDLMYSKGCPVCESGIPADKKWPWSGIELKLQPLPTLFARPCPIKPEHGFVESRKIQTKVEAEGVLREALAVDPLAEILLMPYIECTYSGIYIPESGLLIVGPGNDGATAGKNSISIPTIVEKVDATFRTDAGIAKDEHTYFELLYHTTDTKTPKAVQARSGPPTSNSITEYIPKKFTVQAVLEPVNDLIAWKSMMESVADLPGVCAWQPGGSLADHAAIHARQNNIPFLIRATKPEIGEVIQPTKAQKQEIDIEAFYAGVRLAEGATASVEKIKDSLSTAIAILHNSIPLETASVYSRLIGYAVSALFRGGALACLGEARHYKPNLQKSELKLSREEVYKAALSWSSEDLIKKISAFSYRFMHTSWGKSFGGWKWFTALVQTTKLWNAISEGIPARAIEEANVLLEMAHNGGWLFNKFMHKSEMDQIALSPSQGLARFGDVIYQLSTWTGEYKAIKPRKLRVSSKWIWDVEPQTASGSTLRVTTSKMIWASILNNAEAERVFKDIFEHL